ncbi:HORMA domain-containing protein [Lipomyces japonicus]|uniref:HORMA domain-containing protein n=1 Tax=Lipomyces japonicus TaxID=56871 RepID=UPI0034CE8E16
MAQLFRSQITAGDQSLLSKVQSTTPRQSQELVQTFLLATFGCLTFLRGIFSDDNFVEERFVGSLNNVGPLNPKDYVRLKKLKRGLSNQADTFLDWIEKGIFDALDRKYLKAIVFAIYLDPQHAADITESYTFNIAYRDDSGTVAAFELHDSLGSISHIGVSPDDVRKNLQQMMRRFIMITQTLAPLPDDRYLTIRLVFDDSACPHDYQPPGFKDASNDTDLQFLLEQDQELLRQDAGTLNSGWHAVSLKIASIPEKPEELSQLSQRSKAHRVELAAQDLVTPQFIVPQVRSADKVSTQSPTIITTPSSNLPGSLSHDLQAMFNFDPSSGTQGDTQVLSQLLPLNPVPTTKRSKSTKSQKQTPASVAAAVEKLTIDTPKKTPPNSKKKKLESQSDMPGEISHMRCECGYHKEDAFFDLVQCDRCSEWRHVFCYGYANTKEISIDDSFVCITCQLPRISVQSLAKIKILALFRCAVRVLLSFQTGDKAATHYTLSSRNVTALLKKVHCSGDELLIIFQLLIETGFFSLDDFSTPSVFKRPTIMDDLKLYFNHKEDMLTSVEFCFSR